LVRGTLIVSLAGFFYGIPAAIRVDPSLPEVVITTPPDIATKDIPNPLEGWLVAHSDGFWHLFVIAKEGRELLSIPDDKVLVVRMLAEEAATSEDAKLEEDTKPGAEKAE
jgi:hypothetical protein